MRKIAGLIGSVIISVVLILVLIVPKSVAAPEPEPEYAKWGTIAVKETQRHYQADIIDYLHVGRTNLAADQAEEKFKLWIRTKDGHEFGVFVYIRFNPLQDTAYTIRFERAG